MLIILKFLFQVICNPEEASRNHLCLPRDYNKFDLPHPGTVNIIDIGIDIVDVLRINDKVSHRHQAGSRYQELGLHFPFWDIYKVTGS